MWKRDSKVICVLKINIDDSAQESGQEWESDISMQAIEDDIEVQKLMIIPDMQQLAKKSYLGEAL